jgi:hypothetical protein
VRPVKIADLATLIPSLLERSIFKTTYSSKSNDSNQELAQFLFKYSMFDNYPLTKKITYIWELILNELTTPQQALTKQEIVDLLRPIRQWTILPVKYRAESCLAPLDAYQAIICDQYSDSESINSLFKSCANDFILFDPVLFAFVQAEKRALFNTFLVNLKKNEDLLLLLLKFKSTFEKTVFSSSANCQLISNYLNDCIEIVHKNNYIKYRFKLTDAKALFQSTTQSLIRDLPIFIDLFGVRKSLNDPTINETFLVNLEKESATLKDFFQIRFEKSRVYDLLDFCGHKKLFFVESDPKNVNLYSYLNLREISLEAMYSMFFEWCVNDKPTGINDILNEHVHMLFTELGPARLKNNGNLWKQLVALPFIKVKDRFYSANQVYCDINPLFCFAFEDFILPDEYNYRSEATWKSYLCKLGLKTACDVDDFVNIANKISESPISQTEKLIKTFFDKDLKKLIEKSEEASDKANEKSHTEQVNKKLMVIDAIKSIKFIPAVKYHKKIGHSSSDLIAMSGSAFLSSKSICGLRLPILPDYVRISLNPDSDKQMITAKQAGIITDISVECVLENLNDLVYGLEERNENGREKSALINELTVEQLNQMLDPHYSFLNKILDDKKDDRTVRETTELINRHLRDTNIVLIRHGNGNRELVPASKCVSQMSRTDSIANFMHKLPGKLVNKHWSLFSCLGASESITADRCQAILKNYFDTNESVINKDQFENVLTIMRLFLFRHVRNLSFLGKNSLHLPNMMMSMLPFDKMYYVDDAKLERLMTQNCPTIKSKCLFDFSALVAFLENNLSGSSGRQDEDSECDDDTG